MRHPTGHPAALACLLASVAGAAAVAQSPAGGASAPAAPGAGGVLDRPDPSVSDLLKRLDTLEERNKELETRVTELTREQGEEWMGEQRASQIRDIVRDVLADADQRASLRDGGMTAGWNDGFFLASNDGRFRMNFGGFVQSRFIWSSIQEGPPTAPPSNGFVQDRQVNRYGFDVPDLQLWVDGHVFSRDFQYMVKARFSQGFESEFTKAPNETFSQGGAEYRDVEQLDAWIRVNLDDHWSARFGQFRTPYSRGFLVLEQYQMAASRSVVDFHYALGYTQGLELEYASDESRVRVAVNNGEQDQLLGDENTNNQVAQGGSYVIYPTGSYGAQNAPFWAQTSSYSFTGRADWKPAGKWDQFRSYTSPAMEEFGMLLGAGFHVQQSFAYQGNNSNGTNDPSNLWVAATVDAQLNFGGASFYGAFFYNYLNSPGAITPSLGTPSTTPPTDFVNLGVLRMYAFQTVAATYIIPKVELFGRYEFAMIDGFNETSVPASLQNPDPLNLLTAGVNWYIDGQDIKWTTDLGWAITEVHPWFADINAGWRPSGSDEIVFRTQLQLMF